MRAVMVMFDSLNRRMLPNYGCDWVKAPNFSRLGEMSVTFDSCYAGSMPCMPARRELHTGRYNFMHRSWGPLEPFDDSMPELLKSQGIYTHLVSDHYHYWEDGGATYHNRYSSWEISRGQEGDPWIGEVKKPDLPEGLAGHPRIPGYSDVWIHDEINRRYMDSEEKQPQANTFARGLDFMERNRDADNWFLQIETFDPHEPFFTQDSYKMLYPHDYSGPRYDWPPYDYVKVEDSVVGHARYEYAALVSMCDTYLGKVLDMMDACNMWDDTMLIVNTDHGYMLGEKGWWSKTVMPVYNEIANTPFFCWDPRTQVRGVHRQALMQTIDIAPTLLEFFSVDIPKDMQGHSIAPIIEDDTPVREHALFGYHGGQINITDGKYVYMKGPVSAANRPLFEYTLMPTHMRSMFKVQELQQTAMVPPFPFTKGCPVMKIAATSLLPSFNYGDKLFDLEADPYQEQPIDNSEIEAAMMRELRKGMLACDAPPDEFARLGIPEAGPVDIAAVQGIREQRVQAERVSVLEGLEWERSAVHQFTMLLQLTPEAGRAGLERGFCRFIEQAAVGRVTSAQLLAFADAVIPPNQKGLVQYLLGLSGRLY